MDDLLKQRLVDHLYGRPLVNNVHRGALVEAMVAQELEPDWRWCAGDWAPFDFTDGAGRSLEVKQSASLQSWSGEAAAGGRGSFDIAHRRFRWTADMGWVSEPKRADIYVLAWHGVTERTRADHRDPRQWQFMVIASSRLPTQKTIRLSVASRQSEMIPISNLRAAVERELLRTN